MSKLTTKKEGAVTRDTYSKKRLPLPHQQQPTLKNSEPDKRKKQQEAKRTIYIACKKPHIIAKQDIIYLLREILL